jgi:hypothetical protein
VHFFVLGNKIKEICDAERFGAAFETAGNRL